MTSRRKLKLYQEAQSFGGNASFIANVILTGHSRPTKKLAGLVELLRAGHEVSCVSFHIDILWIDGGGRYTYSDLEKGLALIEHAAAYPNDPSPDYAERVRKLEQEGLTTSDAQAVVDAQISKCTAMEWIRKQNPPNKEGRATKKRPGYKAERLIDSPEFIAGNNHPTREALR